MDKYIVDDIGVDIIGKLVYIGYNGCSNYIYNDLTVGAVYNVIESYIDGYVCVINDRGESEIYEYYLFMDLDSWRELRIKEVLG